MHCFRLATITVLTSAFALAQDAPPAPEAPPRVIPAAAPTAPSPLPTAVDLRQAFAQAGLPPRGQGRRPTCSVFTVVTTLEFAWARASGTAARLSPEFANRAKNVVTHRVTDGGFFHDILNGLATEGIVAETTLPYRPKFEPDTAPTVEADACQAEARHWRESIAQRLRVVWIKPWSNTKKGLDDAQFDAVRATLARGLAVATGMAHSRTLVGYRDDPEAPGGGVFLTLDSALSRFAEVSYEFVRTELFDVFYFEIVPEPEQAAEPRADRGD